MPYWAGVATLAKHIASRLVKTCLVTYDPDQTLADVPLIRAAGWNWEWVDETIVPTVDNNGYKVILRNVHDEAYNLDGVEGYNPTDHSVTWTIPLEVAKAALDALTIASKPYAGSAQTADVTLGDVTWSPSDATAVQDKEYKVTIKVSAGNNYVFADNATATANGNAATVVRSSDGTVDVSYTFADKIDISKATVQLAATSVVCDGKAKEPAVASVVLDGKTLAAGTDFTVSYADNVAPGTATVTVTGVGAYAGSAKATFAIRLGKAKIATVARPGAKAVKVTWKKVPGAKKYQVQWRERGGKWKSKTVKAAKATVKGLKRGKLYDVRVRAVTGSTKGSWSAQGRRWLAASADVKAASAKSGAIKVTWKKTPKANAGYKVVVRYSKSGKAVATKTFKANKTSATVKGLEPGKKAYVEVLPLRKAGSAVYTGALTRAKSSVKVTGKRGVKAQSAQSQGSGSALTAAAI